tara:strand:+ start:202 stop:600 length:399 start_codon:yes stop_codon:yes gene_type:complete
MHPIKRRREFDSEEVIVNLRKHVEALERKKLHIQRAFYTMVRDVRNEATIMRRFIERIDEEGEESYDTVVDTVSNISKNMIALGHCPLSQQPLGEYTFINVCGHIFDKRALFTERPKLCPKCSNVIVIPAQQ